MKIYLKEDDEDEDDAILRGCAGLTFLSIYDMKAALYTSRLWLLHRNRMDPRAKFGSEMENDDATHTQSKRV